MKKVNQIVFIFDLSKSDKFIHWSSILHLYNGTHVIHSSVAHQLSFRKLHGKEEKRETQ
jgi:hypothetical protein